MRAPAAINLRAALGLAAALVAALAAGVVFLGFGGGSPAAAAAAPGGCTERPFAYDAAELARQRRLESGLTAGGATLPPVGFHAEALDPVASLHGASHGYIVVYYRAGTATAELKAFAEAALEQKVPVLVSPRRQADPVVAITQDRELTCSGGSGVRAFAARYNPSLAA
jgi:hypothetical protein